MDNSATSVGASDSSGDSSADASVVDQIKWCVERIAVGFDRWEDPYAHGPGLYFVVERDAEAAYAEPMGSNRWPVEDCGNVLSSLDALTDAAEGVAFTCDGAVIVNSDGTVEEEMVRVKQLSDAERDRNDTLPYAQWMGARHMSALETSTREAVLAAITLSEEDGRMTVFRDGTFEDYPRDVLATE